MDRFYFQFKDFCLLSLLSILTGAGAILLFFSKSSWDFAFSDIKEEVLFIPEVNMVAEYPLKSETIDLLLKGKDLKEKTFSTIIEYKGTNNTIDKNFHDQAILGFKKFGTSLPKDLDKKNFAFYVDIETSRFRGFNKAFIFYYAFYCPYKLYVNSHLQRESDGRDGFVGGGQILDLSKEKTRLLFLFENNHPDYFRSIAFRYGLSIRSEKAMLNTYTMLPGQAQFPRWVGSTGFLIIGLVAFLLAFSSKYLDLFSFGAVSLLTAGFIWAQNPIFYISFQKNGSLLGVINILMAWGIVVFFCLFTLSYFRLEGRYIKLKDFKDFFSDKNFGFRVTLLGTIIIGLIPVIRYWPMASSMAVGLSLSFAYKWLSYILVASQGAAFSLGFSSLFKMRAAHKKENLNAQVKFFNIRIIISLIFALSMGYMLAAFYQGWAGINLQVGTDFVLLAAIVPACSILGMLYLMINSANRFYQKFSPRLDQIDLEVMAFRDSALKEKIQGCLFVFDLAGMKKINSWRERDEAIEKNVNSFLDLVEDDLSLMVQKDKITWRDKSNEDEFIFAIRAKDLPQTKVIMSEILRKWLNQKEFLFAKWKAHLQKGLLEKIPEEEMDIVIPYLDLHVLFCTIPDMKIKVRGGIDRPRATPDFRSGRFTRLSSLFKAAKADKIAMFLDDFTSLDPDLRSSLKFISRPSAPETIGYAVTSSHPWYLSPPTLEDWLSDQGDLSWKIERLEARLKKLSQAG